MQPDSDTNRTKINASGTAGRILKEIPAFLTDQRRTVISLCGRIAAACSNASDLHKAAAAVLVLVISIVTLVHETNVLYSAKLHDTAGDRDRIVMASAAQDAAESAASEVVQSGMSIELWDARAHLESDLNRQTASLRSEYMKILDRGEGDSFHPGSETERKLWETVRARRKKELSEDPYLILVNKWHYLPDDYEADPVTLPNGQMIGNQCFEPLMKMLEDCAEAGGTPIVCSGYRPHDKQVYLFGEQINRWLYAGYGQEDAEDLAATAVAIPGTSEHELGFAADIYSSENMSLDESQVQTFTQQWLMENCWRYGFVLRYPKDKSDITGIIFEPWHYRYVGDKHAQKIHQAGICLEEYLDETDHPEPTEDSYEREE